MMARGSSVRIRIIALPLTRLSRFLLLAPMDVNYFIGDIDFTMPASYVLD